MKINHSLFEKILTSKEITKKAFSEYAKIPYYTVAGWKKSEKVPAYAMVIARDMIYRRVLDEKAKQQMQKGLKDTLDIELNLLPKEKKRIEVAFWGTNYIAEEIIEEVLRGNSKFVKQFNENVPKTLRDKVMSARTIIDAQR
jgi:hypothetical protein